MQRRVGDVEASWGAGLLSVVRAGPAGVLAIWGPQPSSALAPRPCLLASAFRRLCTRPPPLPCAPGALLHTREGVFDEDQ